VKIKKILIYGSSSLAEKSVGVLRDEYDLVGHIPSENAVIRGSIDLPVVDENVDHDIKLSLQYNKKILNIENAFNVHTGLLPMYGGVDILYHTLESNFAYEQGLTFHKMSRDFDYGNIISKATYPVLLSDTVLDLYKRLDSIFPYFVLSSLKLLETLEEDDVDECYAEKPRIFKRGKIKEGDETVYSNTLLELRELYER
jgi:methionyl-tRNA formyltransferase